jgi:hypothetical protein
MANALTLFQKTNNVGVFGKKFIIGDRASLVSSKDKALPASLSKTRVDALTKDFDFISRHLRQAPSAAAKAWPPSPPPAWTALRNRRPFAQKKRHKKEWRLAARSFYCLRSKITRP